MLRRPSRLTSVGCPKMNAKKLAGKMSTAFARSGPNAREVRRGAALITRPTDDVAAVRALIRDLERAKKLARECGFLYLLVGINVSLKDARERERVFAAKEQAPP